MPRLPLFAAVLVLLAAGLARAQYTGPVPNTGYDDNFNLGFPADYDQVRSPAQMERDREIERRYREVVNARIPDKKPSNDPWKKIRQAPAQVPAYDRHRPL